MLTKVQEIICETQGNIFRCANEQGLDMDRFVPEYMQSQFCKRCMDTLYSPFQMADPEECLDFILTEINIPKLSKPKYKVPFISMLTYYPGLHTVDEDMAVDIINEDKLSRVHYIREN